MGVDAVALERAIPRDESILLDTNVLIAYLEGGQAITDAATLIIDDWVRSGRNQARIGMVSVMEMLVGPERAGRGANDLVDFLTRFPNLIVCRSISLRPPRRRAFAPKPASNPRTRSS